MAAAVSITSLTAGGNNITITFIVTMTGSYPTGGDSLNFATATQDPLFVGIAAQVMSLSLVEIDVASQGGNLTRSYIPICVKTGTPPVINPSTGVKLKVSTTAFGTEHAAAVYESDILNDSISGSATFIKI
jgi:hypothetical protein